MNRRPALMEGYTEFYPFCYLLLAAGNALDAARLVEQYDGNRGRNLHYASAVVFSAFAVEAVVYHIGLDKIPNWAQEERKKGGWEKKLKEVAALGGKTPDFNTAPFKTVQEAFDVRDKLAHGKTGVGELCFVDHNDGMVDQPLPDWLESCLSEARVKLFIGDARHAVENLLVWAGYFKNDIFKGGEGQLHEVRDSNAQPRPAVWKVKNS